MGKGTYTAIILAAGQGKRMKSNVPKQFLLLLDKPVIYYSIKAFEDSPVDRIILVTGEDMIDYMKNEIVAKYSFSKVAAVIAGGKERYDSVYEGLKKAREYADEEHYVLIHDGARCFVDQETIKACMDKVAVYPACVAAVPMKDTIKVVDEELKGIATPDRSKLWQIQTPQVFEAGLAYEAYHALSEELKAGCAPTVTDDTMVVEYYKKTAAQMVMSSYYNIKVTTPEDIVLGEAILASRKA